MPELSELNSRRIQIFMFGIVGMRSLPFMKQSRTIERRQWLTPLLGLAFLLTGVALLVYILFHVSLGTALACALVFVVAALTWRLYNIHPTQRPVLIRQIGKGLLIGLVAAAAYDLSRLAIVEIFALKVWPFEAFRFFGYAIAGEDISRHLAIAVGALYHLGNGVFFSISYCLL